MDPKIYEIMNFSHSQQLPLQTGVIVMAAEQAGLQWKHVKKPWKVAIGIGKEKIYFDGMRTSTTSKRALAVCWNKSATYRVLSRWRIPVPHPHLVSSSKTAVRVAKKLGLPVVVKPYKGGGGRGVTTCITSLQGLRKAYKHARRFSYKVIVEKHVFGQDYRILVIDKKVVAVANRIAACVIGDGIHSIRELVRSVNSDMRRSKGNSNILTRIPMNHDLKRMLRVKGYTEDSKPPKDEVVWLRSVANLCAGGTSIDVTDLVHPHNLILATRVARKLGLRMAGIDFICPDISQSYRTCGGVIIDVNRCPDLRVHLTPQQGIIRDVGKAVISSYFPKKSWDKTETFNSLITKRPSHASGPSTKVSKIRIAVYDDLGCPRTSLDMECILNHYQHIFQIDYLKAKDFRAARLKGFDVLVQGGGSPVRQADRLSATGINAIKNFVFSGGGYLGICAGARLAGIGNPAFLQIINADVVDREHWKRGRGEVQLRMSMAGKMQLAETRNIVKVMYHQGPLLVEGNHKQLPPYTALAYFDSEIRQNDAPIGVMLGTTAIASGIFGNGRVVVISPHPEQTIGEEKIINSSLFWLAKRNDGYML